MKLSFIQTVINRDSLVDEIFDRMRDNSEVRVACDMRNYLNGVLDALYLILSYDNYEEIEQVITQVAFERYGITII